MVFSQEGGYHVGELGAGEVLSGEEVGGHLSIEASVASFLPWDWQLWEVRACGGLGLLSDSVLLPCA